MALVTYFVQGASGKCPKCPSKRYTGSAHLSLNTEIACLGCGRTRKIGDALRSSMEIWIRKKLAQQEPL
jgi:hypothetical protein